MVRLLKTLVALVGGAAIAGALAVVLLLSLAYGAPAPAPTLVPTLPAPAARQPAGALPGSSDLRVAGLVGGLVAAAALGVGAFAWVKHAREPWFQEQVDELFASGWVRVVGIPLASGVLGGALYLVMERVTATPERPPSDADLLPFMGGMTFLGLLACAPLEGLLWLLARKRAG